MCFRNDAMKALRHLLPVLLLVAIAVALPAQTVKTLVSFGPSWSNGAQPYAALTLAKDGNFYGTTSEGGGLTSSQFPNGAGTFFRVTTNGALSTLAQFNIENGALPYAALALGPDGNLYGTTVYGGASANYYSSGFGTIFRITTNWILTTLVSFNRTNGAYPFASLTLGRDGNFYGTTTGGGSNDDGTVFVVTTNGALTTLLSFNGTNGAGPTGLSLGNDGKLRGTTSEGGITNSSHPYGYGTVFQITTNGNLTTLVFFSGTNGASPRAGLTLGEDGNFYGTTFAGGNTNASYSNGAGTIFMMTTNGILTTLVCFSGTNGAEPVAGLTLGPDGSFYGTTSVDGANLAFPPATPGEGTIFRATTGGLLTTLFTFPNGNGVSPIAGVSLGPDHNFYGTTVAGGYLYNDGTIFRLSLAPKLELRCDLGLPLLNLYGLVGDHYVIQCASNLAATNWINLFSATNLNANPYPFLDLDAAGQPARFYRAVQVFP